MVGDVVAICRSPGPYKKVGPARLKMEKCLISKSASALDSLAQGHPDHQRSTWTQLDQSETVGCLCQMFCQWCASHVPVVRSVKLSDVIQLGMVTAIGYIYTCIVGQLHIVCLASDGIRQ